MSHFSVAVFSDGRKSVEELLAPYQDNNMGDCPPEHLEFVSVTESMREEYETGECKMVCLQDGRYIYPWDGEGLKKEFAFKVYDDGRDHSDFAGKKDVQLLVIGDPCLGGGSGDILFGRWRSRIAERAVQKNISDPAGFCKGFQ